MVGGVRNTVRTDHAGVVRDRDGAFAVAAFDDRPVFFVQPHLLVVRLGFLMRRTYAHIHAPREGNKTSEELKTTTYQLS